MYFWHIIGTGIKYIWKTINIIREIVLNFIFLIIVLLIFAFIGFVNDFGKADTVPQFGILVLDLEGIIVDSTPYDQEVYQLRRKLFGDKADPSRENNLFELAQKIDQATSDPGIKGMILKLDNLAGADLPSLQYLGKYINRFKAVDKPIYAIGSHFDQKQYYLASFADKIYLANQGSVSLFGFAANNLYFKSLLDNLKVNTHVFKVGTYKSAVEPFTRDDMSTAAKENTQRWLNAMWNNYLTDISTSRNQPANNLVPPSDVMLSRLRSVSGSMSEYALENGIVDSISSDYQFKQETNHIFNYEPELSIYDYRLYPTRMQSFDKSNSTKPLISTIFINGTISAGNSMSNVAGSDTVVKQLRDIGDNSNVRAVVIRMNTPGGSVYASEAIRNEIEALQSKDIPVVISMGGVAASGGYWIASQSDHIVANQNTVTGSIGIFGIIPTFERSLSHIGVHTDGVATSTLANINIAKDLPDDMNQLIQMNIENGYDTFVSLVAKARNKTNEEVEQIAQGQVWLGEEAKQIGLIDQLGDFDDAIQTAASLAGLSEYSIDWQKTKISLFETLFADYSILLPKSVTEVIYNQLPISKQLQQHVSLWDNLNDPQNRYIYCLNCADVK